MNTRCNCLDLTNSRSRLRERASRGSSETVEACNYAPLVVVGCELAEKKFGLTSGCSRTPTFASLWAAPLTRGRYEAGRR